VALELAYGPGQTPLDPEEAAGLLPKHITNQGQLNEWEQTNILQAVRWLISARVPEVLTEDFCRELHRRMFGQTWAWAGQFRQSDKNIGCDWRQIVTRLNQLLGNTQYWLANTVFPIDEIATRFHHQLVLVHAFPNGNGRHSRLMTDRLLRQCAAKPFTWSNNHDLAAISDVRQRYLASLRAADADNLGPLMQFVRA
jgi:Fic-DOC domain mobile mystery protein B